MTEIQTATITDARNLSPHVREIDLLPDTLPMDYLPGQWISLRLPVGEKPPLNRAYTLARPSSPEGHLTLCFDRVENGIGSNYLWNLPIGSSLEFTGPVGNFIRPNDANSLLFVAHYTGIVPFRAMLRQIANSPTPPKIQLVYDAPNEAERIYHQELDKLRVDFSWFTYHPVCGTENLIEVLTNELVPPFSPMVCGIREFTLPVRQILMEQFGFERKEVKLENYSGPSR